MVRTKTMEAQAIDEEEEEKEEEAIRMKTVAEEKYKHSKLKSALKYAKKAQRICPNLDGITDMVTAFKILYVYSKSPSSGPDWYRILEVEPFSHINSIKKQYKKLALILHPDKNTCIASEEAFKRVSEANQVLSDKIRRKEYDLKLRIALQSQAIASATNTSVESSVVDTFWTACSRCQLFHEFDRQYFGQFLRCPSCKKSFFAEEVTLEDAINVEEIKEKDNRGVRTKGSTSSIGKEPVRRSSRVPIKRKLDIYYDVSDSPKKPRSSLKFCSKKVEENSEMTLAQMQLEAKRKAQKAPEKMNVKNKKERSENVKVREKENEKNQGENDNERAVVANLENNGDLEMVVEDSDFHDFDKDRTERCFKKSQVWAIYDDDNGMPRLYGLIDEVESVNPFVVKMSWLDMESNGSDRLICCEKSGFHISCGRFKVSRKIIVNSLNIFSHLVQCERVAREVYWIYPKKGSIWALYSDTVSKGEGNQRLTETQSYDIVVSLTTYSEMHGLSMAYLEKLQGFKSIFRRRDIGCHAIKWIEKDDFRLFSHQIPAKMLSGSEGRGLPEVCWELDPASLPPEMLSLGWER